jgi:hypothetical protein
MQLIRNAKKALLLTSGVGFQKFGEALMEEEEFLAKVSDCIMEVYALESIALRAIKLAQQNKEAVAELMADATKAYAFEAITKIDKLLKECLFSVSSGDELKILLSALRRFMKYTPGNLRDLYRKIAHRTIEKGIE